MKQNKAGKLIIIIAVALVLAGFFSASWYFQRDKIQTMKREQEALQEEGRAKMAYNDCIFKNMENQEACDPLKKLMEDKAKAFSEVHSETTKKLYD